MDRIPNQVECRVSIEPNSAVDQQSIPPNQSPQRPPRSSPANFLLQGLQAFRKNVVGSSTRTPPLCESLPGRQELPKWQGKDRFTITSGSDWVVKNSAKVNAGHRKVPEAQRFTLGSTHTPKGKTFGQLLTEHSLEGLTLTSRLDIHGHGSAKTFESLSAAQLATALHGAGLRQVGVLKLQACDVGKGSFLEDLKHALQHLGVEVGYVCGPVGNAADIRTSPGKIGGRELRISPPFFPKVVTRKGIPVPEKFGLRTVKGEVDIAFPGTRYDIPTQQNKLAHSILPLPHDARLKKITSFINNLSHLSEPIVTAQIERAVILCRPELTKDQVAKLRDAMERARSKVSEPIARRLAYSSLMGFYLNPQQYA